MLAWLGPKVNLGAIGKSPEQTGPSPFWRRIGELSMRHPVATALVCTGALLAVASPALHMRSVLARDRLELPDAAGPQGGAFLDATDLPGRLLPLLSGRGGGRVVLMQAHEGTIAGRPLPGVTCSGTGGCPMRRAAVDGVSLEYDERGSGAPVVFIHGAHLGDTFAPLLEQPSLHGFRLIRYRRRGFAGSSRAEGPVSIREQAADCLALMRRLAAEPAHVVGHSAGGVIALQLALDAPDAVRSLTLLEPALLDVPSGPQITERIDRTIEVYEAGDKTAAVDGFLQVACGKSYRAVVDKMLPGALTQAIADADTFFRVDFPAIRAWTFSREDAARIGQPALIVLGAESDADWRGFGEGHRLLLDWLPRARPFVLARAAHLLQVENPSEMAQALAAFLADVSPG